MKSSIIKSLVFVLLTASLSAELLKPINGFKYEPFYEDRWKENEVSTEMTVWKGEEIAFLTLDDSVDAKVITPLVERLDKGWKTYRDLIGKDPNPFKMYKDKPIIAAIPEGFSCGAGCGFVGSTGVELCLFYSRDYDLLKENPASCPHYIFYEMGRNFYVFGEKHSYFATGFAVFMRYVCMDATESKDVEEWERKEIEAIEGNIRKADELSFLEIFTTVGDEARRERARAAGLSDSQNSNHASVMLYLRKEYGGDEWIKQFYKAIDTAEPYPVNSENAPYLQSLGWMVAASIAAGEDLTPLFVERYRFPIPKEDQETLAKIDWDKKSLKVGRIVGKLSPTPEDG